MKILYGAFGIAILAGVAYASFTLGSNKGVLPTNTTPTDQTDNSVFPDNDSSDVIPTTPDFGNQQPTGARSITMSYPKNGAVVETDPFTVKGTVSANATKIVVTAYATAYYDGLSAHDPQERKLDEYALTKFKLGDTTWSYTVGTAFGNVSHASTAGRFVVTATFADGSTKQTETKVTYAFAEAEMGKPVVYAYPRETMPVHVNVAPIGGLSVTEPVISATGWDVIAHPDGTLVTSDGKSWPYLFWEGFAANFVTPKEGFMVARRDLVKFFDGKLAYLGLNKQEISDFKDFWISRMQDKPYYFVTFIPQKTFDTYAPLTVSPKPDTVIRVFFDYRGLLAPTAVIPQILPTTPERLGFVVTEWGGRLYR